MLIPSRRAGFSLIELMVAVAAMGLVLFYTLATFTANRNTYVVIDNVSEVQQNSIAIASIIERDLRNAGYKVPGALATCGVDSTTGPDMLFVSDADAIRDAHELPSSLAGTPLSLGLDLGESMPSDWTGSAIRPIELEDLIIDGEASYGATGDFRVDAGVIFADLDDPGQVFCGRVTAIDAANDEITVDLSEYTAAVPGTTGNWAFVPAHVYRIVGETLERNGMPIAHNVEDLQMAWFYDLDQDEELDADENFGAAGEPELDWAAISDAGVLREVRFNLVVKTSESDPTNERIGAGQPRENRTNAAGGDGFRRRVHTATIRLRNLPT